MPDLHAEAFAKINISLDVLGKRDDGYHELDMIMQTVSLSDRIRIKTGGGETGIRQNLSYLPVDGKNLAMSAATVFYRELGEDPDGVMIELHKRIPVGAGLGGGSADAGAVLTALNAAHGLPFSTERLSSMGSELGSDVPYFILGGTARVTGRGEISRALRNMPNCAILLCKPNFSVSTARAFFDLKLKKITCHPDTEGIVAAIEMGDIVSIARRVYNVMEDVAASDHREIGEIRGTMLDCGALGASMSGSGPTVFGIFDREDRAREAGSKLKAVYRDTFLTKPVFF